MFVVNVAKPAFLGVSFRSSLGRDFWIRLTDRIAVLFYFIEPQLGASEAVPHYRPIVEDLFVDVQRSKRNIFAFSRALALGSERQSSAQVDSKCTASKLSKARGQNATGSLIRLVHFGYTWSPLAKLSAMNQMPVPALAYS